MKHKCVCIICIVVLVYLFMINRTAIRNEYLEFKNQPIVMLTHTYTDNLEALWRGLDWQIGDKQVLCDGEDTASKWIASGHSTTLIDHNHTKSKLKHSVEQSHLKFKAWDSFFVHFEDVDFEYIWVIENDVMYTNKVMTQVQEKYKHEVYDFIGYYNGVKNEKWMWHKTSCNNNQLCNTDVHGSSVNFCRLSKRLYMEVLKLVRENNGAYLEKILPGICQVKNWPMISFDEKFVHKKYSYTTRASKKECIATNEILHKCVI